LILGIETSASLCSLCLWDQNKAITYAEADIGVGHASVLFELLERIEKESGLSLKNITHVAIARGPGSFTGIRVGLSFATGLALAGNLPILGLTCFEIALHKLSLIHTFGVAFDTKRQDFYGAFYQNDQCLEMGIWTKETLLQKQKSLNASLWTDVPQLFEEATPLRLTAQDVAHAAAFYQKITPNIFSQDPFYLRPPKVYE